MVHFLYAKVVTIKYTHSYASALISQFPIRISFELLRVWMYENNHTVTGRRIFVCQARLTFRKRRQFARLLVSLPSSMFRLGRDERNFPGADHHVIVKSTYHPFALLTIQVRFWWEFSFPFFFVFHFFVRFTLQIQMHHLFSYTVPMFLIRPGGTMSNPRPGA